MSTSTVRNLTQRVNSRPREVPFFEARFLGQFSTENSPKRFGSEHRCFRGPASAKQVVGTSGDLVALFLEGNCQACSGPATIRYQGRLYENKTT